MKDIIKNVDNNDINIDDIKAKIAETKIKKGQLKFSDLPVGDVQAALDFLEQSRETQAKYFRINILKGLDNDDALANVILKFPEMMENISEYMGHVKWYRTKLRKAGYDV